MIDENASEHSVRNEIQSPKIFFKSNCSRKILMDPKRPQTRGEGKERTRFFASNTDRFAFTRTYINKKIHINDV